MTALQGDSRGYFATVSDVGRPSEGRDVPANGFDEIRPELVHLPLADAADEGEFREGDRATSRHIAQGGVRENQIGGDAAPVGELLPERAKTFKEGRIVRFVKLAAPARFERGEGVVEVNRCTRF